MSFQLIMQIWLFLFEISFYFPLSKMDLSSRPKLFDFHGVAMIPIFTANWENVQNFQARPDDILIATYPKAGKST